MRIAVIGPEEKRASDISAFIPEGACELITADLPGICRQALQWADRKQLPRVVVKPVELTEVAEPGAYLRAVISEVDLVILIDDGASEVVWAAREHAERLGKSIRTFSIK